MRSPGSSKKKVRSISEAFGKLTEETATAKDSEKTTPLKRKRVATKEATPVPFRHRSALPDKMEKMINDAVHGIIKLEPLCVRIVDTPEYQRLHFLKQLGTCDFVFRGATHTRFEHSIGVAHLAEKFATQLQTVQPALGITPIDILCIKVAGLCHDLGHGPFSHVFDGVFIRRMYPNGLPADPTANKEATGGQGKSWRHEDGSVRMLRYLIASNSIDLSQYGLDECDVLFIEEVINGTPEANRRGRNPKKFFLYDIVNNLRSGLDVDKLDYFQRDAKMSGVSGVNIDFSRFIKKARVLAAQPIGAQRDPLRGTYPPPQPMICYSEKMVSEAVSLFRTRFDMHKQVYTHQAVKQVEFMITDAMELADPYIRIAGNPTAHCPDGQYRMSQAIFDMKALSNLNDGILHVIMANPDPALQPAQHLITRIFKRELYRCVGRTALTPGDASVHQSEEDILREIVACSAAIREDSQGSGAGSQIHIVESGGHVQLFEGCSLLEDDMYANFSQESDGGTLFYDESIIHRRHFSPREGVGGFVVLEEKDLIVEKMHVHFGMKAANPVANMRFYPKNFQHMAVTPDRPYQAVMLEERVYETDLPRVFEYRSVRVFSRNPEKDAAAAHAFEKWCDDKKLHQPLYSSFSQTGDASLADIDEEGEGIDNLDM